MAPPIVGRRPDGLVQIRRVRARDVVLTYDTATVLMLFAGFVFFAIVLFLTLVFDPPLLGVGLWAIVAVAVDSRRSRPPRGLRLVPHPTPPPPHGAA